MRASGLSGGGATPGPGCGVTESLDNQLGGGATVVASSSLNVNGTSSFDNYNVTGSAQAPASGRKVPPTALPGVAPRLSPSCRNPSPTLRSSGGRHHPFRSRSPRPQTFGTVVPGAYTLFNGQYQFASGNGVTITPSSVTAT